MSSSLRESFGLEEYTDEFIDKIINYRMYKDKEKKRYLNYEEIAERENCSAEDVSKILRTTTIIWGH